MRRLPIYFLIDVSESMVGEPITQVEKGMRNIIQELRTDPYALETVFVSVIVFAGKAKILARNGHNVRLIHHVNSYIG